MSMWSCNSKPITEGLYWKKILISKGCIRGSLLRGCLLFLIILAFVPQLCAQQYLTLGVGYGMAFWGSEDLSLFRETYNFVNEYYLAERMRGFSPAVGVRWEIGYRHFGRLGTAVLVGSQSYTAKDVAQYQNGEVRRLDLRMSSMYVECEIGPTYKKFFVNGVFTFFFNRKLTLESVYSAPMGEVSKNPLDGTYEGDISISTDLGISVGIFREPIILTCKITYPLFTGGRSTVLHDRRIEKIANRTNIFPDDYEAYLYGRQYHGIKSNIDGLKILITAAAAFQIKK